MTIKIVIKTSPFVFIKRLIFIELFIALLLGLFWLWFDPTQIYNDLQLARFASFSLVVGLVIMTFQILAIITAFITWYVDVYEIDAQIIAHRRGNFLGTTELARTQTITDIKITRSKLGENFNFGLLELTTLDETNNVKLRDIPNPAYYANSIKALITPSAGDIQAQLQKPIPELIAAGEGQNLEFKASFSWDYRQQRINKDLNKATMKNIAGFMNTTGGIVLLGVSDDSEILGLEVELQTLGKPNVDGFENVFNMAFNKMIGTEYHQYITVDFVELDGKTVCRVSTLPAREPIFLKEGDSESFYIRTGNSSQRLTMSKAMKYIQSHFDSLS